MRALPVITSEKAHHSLIEWCAIFVNKDEQQSLLEHSLRCSI